MNMDSSINNTIVDSRDKRVSFSWQEGDDVASLISLRTEASSAERGTAAGASTVASRMRFAEPSETLIFYDWDDTLFPTSGIFDQWGFSSRKEQWGNMQLSSEQLEDLQSWRETLQRYLTIACALSDGVVIVTNSRRPWVGDCINQFAPNLQPLFDSDTGRIKVVYAQEELSMMRARPHSIVGNTLYAESGITQEEHDEIQTKAKIAAMRKEVRSFYSQYRNQSWKNILSCGDMRYEHDAVQEVTFQRDSPARERLRTKAIIVWSEPSVAAMTSALAIWCHLISACVHFDGDIDMDFSNEGNDRAKIVADALHMPDLIDILPTPLRNLPANQISSKMTKDIQTDIDVGVAVHEAMFD